MLIMFGNCLINTENIQSVRIRQNDSSFGSNHYVIVTMNNEDDDERQQMYSECYTSYDNAFKRLEEIRTCSIKDESIEIRIMDELSKISRTVDAIYTNLFRR